MRAAGSSAALVHISLLVSVGTAGRPPTSSSRSRKVRGREEDERDGG